MDDVSLFEKVRLKILNRTSLRKQEKELIQKRGLAIKGQTEIFERVNNRLEETMKLRNARWLTISKIAKDVVIGAAVVAGTLLTFDTEVKGKLKEKAMEHVADNAMRLLGK